MYLCYISNKELLCYFLVFMSCILVVDTLTLRIVSLTILLNVLVVVLSLENNDSYEYHSGALCVDLTVSHVF